jgi:iron complex outermembrane receptor protein
MLNPRYFFFFFLVLLTTSLSAQNCEISVQGIIRDIKSKEAIANASIYSLDAEQGAVSNRQGYFQLQGLCAGDLHLLVSHIGCSPSTMWVDINTRKIFKPRKH